MGERGVEVAVDLDVPGDIGLGGSELTGMPQQAAYGVARAQLDERSIDRPSLRAVPGTQPDGQVAAHEGPQRSLQALRHPVQACVGAKVDRDSVVVIARPSRVKVSCCTSM